MGELVKSDTAYLPFGINLTPAEVCNFSFWIVGWITFFLRHFTYNEQIIPYRLVKLLGFDIRNPRFPIFQKVLIGIFVVSLCDNCQIELLSLGFLPDFICNLNGSGILPAGWIFYRDFNKGEIGKG